MLVSCFNKCVIMHIVVKLDFAADLTLFPEYTIIRKINIIKNQAEFPIPSPNLWNAVMGRGTPLSYTLSLVVWPYCAVALPPHLCHGHNCGLANPSFLNPAYRPDIMPKHSMNM